MEMIDNKQYVIIGNGVAGINAALAIRERTNKAKIIIISRETEYYYSRTALMYIAMDQMRLEDTEPFEREFYALHTIDLLYGNVTDINTEKKNIILENQTKIEYDSLLLATGAKVETFGWPGLELNGVAGFISYQDLQEIMKLVQTAKHAVVVGGGLIGVELCEVFKHHNIDVTFLIRGQTYWRKALSKEEGLFVQNHMAAHNITLMTGEELQSINGDNGSVISITTKTGKEIACDIVGIATGVQPEISLARKAGIQCAKGILTDWHLKTSEDDIFAAGDCIEIISENENFMEPIWYTARDMGKVAGYNMSGFTISYDPGEYYNSAKFFEKEYTVVGRYGKLQPNETDLIYQDKDQSIRIILKDNKITGFSMIGSRWDHEILLKYIREKRDVHYFMDNYEKARFDPEFHKNLITFKQG